MGDVSASAAEAAALRQRNRELSMLNTVAQALSRSVDLDAVLQLTLAQIAQLFDLRTGWVWLLREHDGRAYLAASQHLPSGLANNPRKMEGWCHCLETFEDGDMTGAANVNVITCTRLRDLVDGTDGLRYHASIPLYAEGGKRLGVMNVASSDWRELSQDDLRLLHTIGDLLSIAVERSRLFARSSELGAVEERNRLAREIHDTLAQGLAAVALQLESADAMLEGGVTPAQLRPAVQQALSLVRENLEEARRSVLDLRAATLEGRSLPQALRVLARDTTANGGPTIHFTVVGASVPLSQRVEVGLYRIIREALANVLQHAAARNVNLRLVATAQSVRCTIRDDGSGFDTDQMPPGHFGLIGVNERAHLLGGTLRVTSAPGRGTQIDVTIPLGGSR